MCRARIFAWTTGLFRTLNIRLYTPPGCLSTPQRLPFATGGVLFEERACDGRKCRCVKRDGQGLAR